MSDMAQTQMHHQVSGSSAARPRGQAPAGKPMAVRKRNPWLTLAIFAWLLFLTVVVGNALLQSTRHQEQWQERAQDTGGSEASLAQSVLAERVEDVAGRLQTETASLRESVQTEFAAVRQNLEEKTAALTAQLDIQATDLAGEIVTIKDAIKALEARFAQERQTVITTETDTARPQPAKRPPPSIKPPFQVIGVEQRGSERFLTVTRQGSQSVADIQLLRVGTRFGAWLLEAIEEGHAVFRVEDAIVRLPIPRLPILSGLSG